MQPPHLPIETLARVLRLARLDGMGALVIATFFALTAASIGEIAGATVWLLVAGMGAIELHGVALLRAGGKRGLNWLIASQYLLLLVVLVHCGLRFAHYDPTAMRQAMTPEMRSTLAQANYEEEDFLRMVYVGTYSAIAATMLVYKLCLVRYYHRRRTAIHAAVDGAV